MHAEPRAGMAGAAARTVAVLLPLIVVAAACGGSSSPTPPTPPLTPSVTSVTVTGSTPVVGASSQFAAVATLSTGTTQSVTTQAAWQSSNTAIATVSSGGVVTAVTAGGADITATYQSVVGRAHVTVAAPRQTTFSVGGLVTDGTSGGVLPNIDIRISSGANAGVATRTDATGRYTIAGVVAGPLTLSASAVSYDTVDTAVTIAGDTRVDFVLPRSADRGPHIDPDRLVAFIGERFNITATRFTPGGYVNVCTQSSGRPPFCSPDTFNAVRSDGTFHWQVAASVSGTVETWGIDVASGASSNHLLLTVP